MEETEQLVLKAQKGDKLAFGKIYNLFYKKIYRFIYINIRNVDKSQDLCQETFIKAWRALPSFSLKYGGSLQAYLFKIAKNSIIDLSRKKKEISLELIGDIEDKEDIDEKIIRKHEEQKLKKALLKLEKTDRKVVILRYFRNFSFSEISQDLKIKEGALRVRVHRSLKKLRKMLNVRQ